MRAVSLREQETLNDYTTRPNPSKRPLLLQPYRPVTALFFCPPFFLDAFVSLSFFRDAAQGATQKPLEEAKAEASFPPGTASNSQYNAKTVSEDCLVQLALVPVVSVATCLYQTSKVANLSTPPRPRTFRALVPSTSCTAVNAVLNRKPPHRRPEHSVSNNQIMTTILMSIFFLSLLRIQT